MPLLQQVLDVLVQVALAHILRGVMVANHRPALPFAQPVEGLFSAHSLPCQQAYEVSQEQLNVLATEAAAGLVVPLVFGFIDQRVDGQIDANIIPNERPNRFVLPQDDAAT